MAGAAADIGILPCFELTRQELEIVPGTGIACHGPVRSILLVSQRPAAEIRTLAVDTSSRTSVQLARVILERRYGAEYTAIPHAPDLDAMLRVADAALIIGDPALRLDPQTLPYEVHDLGGEWVEMTGLPMVFAVWAARPGMVTPRSGRRLPRFVRLWHRAYGGDCGGGIGPAPFHPRIGTRLSDSTYCP